jgi:glucosamine-phosphate N-acetyltransferase
MDVLGQLTVVGDVTKESFEQRYDWLFPKHSDTYFIIVIVDRAKDKVVGSATLMLERKFLRSTGTVS